MKLWRIIVEVFENLHLVVGDLLDSDAQFIAHQCNCQSSFSYGIAKSIFEKYPYANTYKNHKNRGMFGLNHVFSVEDKHPRGVINMYAQEFPGKANPNLETHFQRLSGFKECLKDISLIIAPRLEKKYNLITN